MKNKWIGKKMMKRKRKKAERKFKGDLDPTRNAKNEKKRKR